MYQVNPVGELGYLLSYHEQTGKEKTALVRYELNSAAQKMFPNIGIAVEIRVKMRLVEDAYTVYRQKWQVIGTQSEQVDISPLMWIRSPMIPTDIIYAVTDQLITWLFYESNQQLDFNPIDRISQVYQLR